jgi:hypothetical protein
MEFLVTGFDASVTFVSTAPAAKNEQLEILHAEQGQYADGSWQRSRIWNGDQTDRGLNFKRDNRDVVRILLQAIPLHDPAFPHK